MTKTIAYLRVSTNEQDLKKNRADILHLANEKNLGKVQRVSETVSGRISWKQRKIAQVIHELAPGDNLIISELSRLGRSMLECMEILVLVTEKKIHIYAVKGDWQLENSLQSKIMAMVFAMAAEIERDLLSQRTKEALAARKRTGVKLGRPQGVVKSKLDQHRPEIEALLKNGATQTYIAKRYETTEANLSQWIEKHGLRRKRG